MTNYYSESAKRELNYRGKPRLVSVLADLPGALHHGFDGDGTPPKRGDEAGHQRLWEFTKALPTPLPDGVAKLTKTAFNKAIADREATRPIPPPPPPPTPQEQARVRALAAIEAIKDTEVGAILHDLAIADGRIKVS